MKFSIEEIKKVVENSDNLVERNDGKQFLSQTTKTIISELVQENELLGMQIESLSKLNLDKILSSSNEHLKQENSQLKQEVERLREALNRIGHEEVFESIDNGLYECRDIARNALAATLYFHSHHVAVHAEVEDKINKALEEK